MGKKRHNKKKNKKTQNKVLNPGQEILDELIALEAVFADDFTLHPDRAGFDIHVVPYPSKVEVNYVSVTLRVKYGNGYPEKPPEIEILKQEGEEHDFEDLLDQLHQSSRELCLTRDVFMFSIIDVCQETLLAWNQSIAAQKQVVERENVEVSQLEVELFDRLRGTHRQGLFGDQPIFGSPPIPRGQTLEAARKLPGQRKIPYSVDRPTMEVAEKGTDDGSKSKAVDGFEDSERSTANDTHTVSRSMVSLVASFIDRIGPLPTGIAQYLGLTQHGTKLLDDEHEIEMSKFKTEALMGHLLKLCTVSHGSLQKDAFPFLCGELHEKGILPDWLHWMLIKQPKLFTKLFRRFFQKEVASAEQLNGGDQIGRRQKDILKEFWTSAERSDESRNASSTTSRYRTDFDEIKVFGKGGFGVVVAAVNRLDGRQYAVKKIKLSSTSHLAYTRIVREVATLARLQHPNVVRYFQAWLEPATEADDLTSEDSVDLDAFGESDVTESPTAPTQFTFSLHRGHIDASSSGSHFPSVTPTGESERPEAAFDICFDSGSKPRSVDLPGSCHRSEAKHVRHQILYIQMEACSRTLQEMLQPHSRLEDEDRWEILRQILLGLSYIHSQRIVHRDLKPPNIFYSASGEVKLGDFGLAKFSAAAGDVGVKEGGTGTDTAVQTPTRHTITTEASGVCGTSFYIAPEIQNRWPSYGSKVDMYSLGIVVFELWHPFSTGMERILLLRDLKEKRHLPQKWKSDHPLISDLVLWLTAANPDRRPSAKELLRSDYLPPRVGDEQLQDLIRSLDNDQETYDHVIEGIFRSAKATKRSEGPGVMPVELSGAPAVHVGEQMEIRDRVCQRVKGIFSRHGAIQMSSQDVGLCYPQLPGDAVRMLSNSGDLYSLKYDMRHPFVDWIVGELKKAESSSWGGSYDLPFPIDNLRRYDIGTVSREGSELSLSRSYLQADVDFIATPMPKLTDITLQDTVLARKLLSEQLLAEAEIIKIVSEVATAFKFSESDQSFEIRLTHTMLIHACLKQLDVASGLLPQCLQLISSMTRHSPCGSVRSDQWMPIQTAMEGLGLTGSEIRNWRRFATKLAGSYETILPQLISALSNNGQTPLTVPVRSALEEIKTLTALLEKWGVQRDQIILDPVMIPDSDYYSGIYFQAHLVHSTKKTSTFVALGGRYDKLLNAALRRRNLTTMIGRYGLVGVTLNLHLLVKKERDVCQMQHPLRNTASDVLVCSKGGGSAGLERRMELISHLWNHAIKAEMLRRMAPNMTAQYDYAVSSGVRILVIIDEKLTSSETVKIKNLERKNEEDVPFSQVVPYIQNILQSRSSYPSVKR